MRFLKDLLPIETERLLLRLLEPEEAQLMVDYREANRDHLQPWEPTRPESFYLPERLEKEVKEIQSQFFHGDAVRLSIFLKAAPAGPIIGVNNFTTVMRGVFQACFLGYSIHHEYEGKGYMYEALEKAVEFMFREYKLHRIMANYMPHNERSAKLLRRLGFTREGFAKNYLKIAGKWEDHVLTAKIKDEG